jgi:hypothetical protein
MVKTARFRVTEVSAITCTITLRQMCANSYFVTYSKLNQVRILVLSCFEIKQSSDDNDMVQNGVDNFPRNHLIFWHNDVNAS